MRRLKENFPQELVIIGVHSAKFPSEHLTANIRQAILREGIDYPVVNDTGFRIWNEYAVRAWPTVVLIDPMGKIAGETSGEILAETMSKEISAIIEKNKAAVNLSPLYFKNEAEREPERPLKYPAKLLLAPGGILFIADSGHHRILQVQLDPEKIGAEGVQRQKPVEGEIVRVFGSGKPGLVDGPAQQACFRQPHGMALKGGVLDGLLYVADTENHAIRAIDLSSGAVRTVAGTGQKAHGRYQLGKPTEVPLRSPWALVTYEHFVFIAMAGSHQIWVLINEDQLGPFAGNGAEALVDGPVTKASFNQPSDLAFGMGHLFVADPEASAIRAITLSENPGTITLVGTGLFDFGDKDGSEGSALLQHPAGLALDENILYIADTYNNKIKTLDPTTGQVTTLIGSGQAGSASGTFIKAELFEPEGLQVANGKIFVADTNNHLIRVADLDTHLIETLVLRGVDKLRMPAEEFQNTNSVRMDAVSVPAGKVQLELDVAVPDGFELNPDAPAVVQIGTGPGASRYVFPSREKIIFPVEVQEDSELDLNLTIYYCETADQGVCRIYDRRVILPVKVRPDAPAFVRLPYQVEPD